MRRFYSFLGFGIIAALVFGMFTPVTAYAVQSPATQFAGILEPDSWDDIGTVDCGSTDDEDDGALGGLIPEIPSGGELLAQYVICPIFAASYSAVTGIVNLMQATGLLSVNPLMPGGRLPTNVNSNNPASGIYAAWAVMRDFANIGLILAGLLLVFSQATSFGISAYGIKKMLPKVFIAAILINLSYIICTLLVDIFNALGAGLKGLLETRIADQFNEQGLSILQEVSESVVAVAPASLALVFTALTILLILLIIALAGLLFLIARQALVVLLIVFAPLAFVAWLFPNTQKYFGTWWGVFIKLLAIYPIVTSLQVVTLIVLVALGSLVT